MRNNFVLWPDLIVLQKSFLTVNIFTIYEQIYISFCLTPIKEQNFTKLELWHSSGILFKSKLRTIIISFTLDFTKHSYFFCGTKMVQNSGSSRQVFHPNIFQQRTRFSFFSRRFIVGTQVLFPRYLSLVDNRRSLKSLYSPSQNCKYA